MRSWTRGSALPETTVTQQPPSPAPVASDREFTVKVRTQREIVLRRFLEHRAAVGSAVVFVLVAVFAFVGPLFWGTAYSTMTNDIEVAPSGTHPFGTDSNGFDLFSQVMHGTQRTLEIALTVAVLATLIGTVYGA